MSIKFFQQNGEEPNEQSRRLIDSQSGLLKGFEAQGKDNQTKIKEKKEKAAIFTRNLLEEDERTRGGPEPYDVGRHMCQVHALLVNHVLNRMEVKSKVVGLDFRWLRITWTGLHYVAKTEDGGFVDAFPESNRLINSDMGEGQVLILSPGDKKYDDYAEGERRANFRDWGAISPDRLEENEKEFPIVLKLYENRINRFIQENK